MWYRQEKRLLNVKDVVKQVKAPGYNFIVEDAFTDTGDLLIWIRVEYTEKDVFSGVDEKQIGRPWMIDKDADDGAIVQTCFKAYLTSLEHRARECFTYMSVALMHPHHSISDLMNTAQVRNHDSNPVNF